MTTPSLIMMISTLSIVTGVTLYFFVRVYNTPPKKEPDSFTDNNTIKR